MLVLTRKQDESIVIGNSIRVTVLELTAGSVRLGFEAAPDVSIYREEIYRAIASANRSVLPDEARAETDRTKKKKKKGPRK